MMPVSVEKRCRENLFQLAMTFGGVAAKAEEPTSTWDLARLDIMVELMVETVVNCRNFEHCATPQGTDVLTALNNIRKQGEEAIPDTVKGLVTPLSDSVQAFIRCLLDRYEAVFDPSINRYSSRSSAYQTVR